MAETTWNDVSSELVAEHPDLEAVVQDHLETYEELLPYVLVIEMMAHLQSRPGFNKRQLQTFFDIAEKHFASGDDHLTMLLRVGFLERIDDDPEYVAMLGPGLSAASSGGVSECLDNDVVFRVEQPFSYTTDAGVTHHLFPEGEPSALSPVLSACRQTLRRGRASRGGELELEFLDGSLVVVPVSEDGEAWGMSSPDGMRLVSLPGGELATRDPPHQ